ncbi:hypothetical protein BJY01DRAFT_256307 [Aspergillus pseudoustus]|uniref:BZIP domain-containing protein n=1 Tax=Aspergillus pseudoustus TaxID=1810923 RepID=A0ABR4IC93_9EURO
MDAEQHHIWPAQSPTPQSSLPSAVVKDVDLSIDMSLQYIYSIFPDAHTAELSPTNIDLDSLLDYQNLSSDSSNLQDESEALQLLGLGRSHSNSAPTTTTSTSPSLSPRPVEPDSAKSSPSSRDDKLIADDRSYSVKRRMQNREAQRRFRERKEEHLTALERRAAVAEERYRKLLKDTEQQITEAAKMRKDNTRLRSEAQRLRDRWRTMLALLQPAQRVVALSVLLAGDAKDDELEEFMRSLKA